MGPTRCRLCPFFTAQVTRLTNPALTKLFHFCYNLFEVSNYYQSLELTISMKTDTLFHELFQLAPQALFELLQIKPGCAYRFESPVVKASERRLDGLLEPADPGHSRYLDRC